MQLCKFARCSYKELFWGYFFESSVAFVNPHDAA